MYLPYEFYEAGAVFAKGWVGFVAYVVVSWILS